MPRWIDGRGWTDEKQRYLFTDAEFLRAYWFAFAMGAASFSFLFFFLGRMSLIYHWF